MKGICDRLALTGPMALLSCRVDHKVSKVQVKRPRKISLAE